MILAGKKKKNDKCIQIKKKINQKEKKNNSADLWVPGSSCPNSICPLARFYEKNSTSFVGSTEIFNIKYGTGGASGYYATEKITISGATIEKQKFGYVDKTQNILTEVPTLDGSSYTPNITEYSATTEYGADNEMDGIFGLGYPLLTSDLNNQYDPFFFNLKANNIISKNIFSIYLSDIESYGDSGEILFGGIDETKYTGNISYLPVVKTTRQPSTSQAVTDYGFWQVNGQGIAVKDGVKESTQARFKETIPFVFDTGTTLSYFPTAVLEAILDAAVGKNNLAYDKTNNYFQIRCSMAKQNTTIQIIMSGTEAITDTPVVMSVPLSDLILPLDSNHMATANICMFGIVPSKGTIFIGESLLRSVYQIYDAEEHRIGIASAISSKATVFTATKNSNSSDTTPTTPLNTSPIQESGSSHIQLYDMQLFCLIVFTIYLLQ